MAEEGEADQNPFDKEWSKHQSSIPESLHLVGNKKCSGLQLHNPNKNKSQEFHLLPLIL